MDVYELIPKLLRSSIDGDRKMMEATALMIVRKIRKDRPDVADEISQVLAYMGAASPYSRSLNLPPLPVDIISRRRCTIPCHVNILYCFKEHFLWSIWESNPFVGEHPSTNPFAYSSTSANYSTPYLGPLASNILSVSSNSLW